MNEIGETDSYSVLPAQNHALQCVSDMRPCCRTNRAGEWYFLNGTQVPQQDTTYSFYRNRGADDGTVNLNRISSDVTFPTGLFCCVLPDIDGKNQTLCANLEIGQLVLFM